MKKITLLFFLLGMSFLGFSQTVFINELHYDNTGGDTGEAVEVAGPAGTDLTGWSIALYNGSNGTVYNTINLNGTIDDEGAGFGALGFTQAGIQNGSPDGLALVDAGNNVIQFLSYEGTLTATNGPANGQTSTDIGISETGSTPVGASLQLIGTGSMYPDFSWSGPTGDSFGTINVGQTFSAMVGNAPIITCPMDIVQTAPTGTCAAIANFAATAFDIEDLDISADVTYSQDSGTSFPVGTTVVTASVTDSDGNTVSCDFNVTINDVENPVATCTDATFELDAIGNVTVNATDVGSGTDNCGIASVQFGSPPVAGALNTGFASNNGAAGNMFDMNALTTLTMDSFDVNLEPFGGTPAGTHNVSVYWKTGTHVGFETDAAAWTFAGSTTVASLGQDVPTPLNLNMGVSINAGETVAWFIVTTTTSAIDYTNGGTVGDVWASDANMEILEGSGRGLNTTDPFAASVFTTRNVNAIARYTAGSPLTATLDFDCDDVGVNTQTITITDDSGNIDTCTVNITIEDNIAPVITCLGEPSGAAVFINEIHYDNAGADQDEAIEIAGPAGTDLSTYSLVLYNGNGGAEYNTVTLSGSIDDEGNGYGAVNFPIAGIQNGSPDGIVLANGTDVIQFLSYEGSFTAVGGIADGLTSTDIGVSEAGSTPVGESLQLTGTGTFYPDFTWTGPVTASPGDLNAGQTINAPMSNIPDVFLDANGMASILASDLLQNVDEACGWTATVPVPGGISTLTTLFNSNNGGALGGAVYFDVTVGAADVTLNGFETNTEDPGAFSMEVYAIEGGTFVGNEQDPAPWTLVGTATGTASGTVDVPSPATLDAPITLLANTTYAMALVMDADHGHNYSGTGSDPAPGQLNYANGDLSIDLGSGSNAPFAGPTFNPRIWNGTLVYESTVPGSSETIELDCDDLGETQIEITVTDDSGNVATCFATVNVIDNIDPILVCQDITVSLDENGLAEIVPEDLFAAGTGDNCAITVTAIDIDEFDCDDIGTPVLVTAFASDASGNLAACTAIVTVIDDLGPEITCPADQTVDPGPNNLQYEVPDYWANGEATAFDNCTDPVTIFTQDPAPGTLLEDGTYTVTLGAEDEYGNVSTCTFELVVESILGLDDNPLSNGVNIYPNPAGAEVTLSNTSGIVIERAAIYDVKGRLVMQLDLSTMGTERTINVAELATGAYLVQLEGAGQVTTKRLIKR